MKHFEGQPAKSLSSPEVRHQELGKKLHDPAYLPSLKELKDYFDYQWHEGDKDGWYNYLGKEWERFSKDGIKHHEKVRYEVLTREHIQGLGKYIANRAAEYKASEEKPLKVLEVGAGDGRLTHFLSQELPGSVDVVATDSFSNEIVSDFPVDIVRDDKHNSDPLSSIRKAIEKYQPDLIISCWMRNGSDWTSTFRQYPFVKEYIIIGGRELCGRLWETWGEIDYYADKKDRPQGEPPFKKDGFEEKYLANLNQFQVCRIDAGPGDETHHSITVSFRRST
ncbi:MAG: hypothetical protein HYZ63_02430 [Candidatus Andersenbacteria bacterium]|nr:hypothetical protein [Candidatus Andersenbacteria bacterium]